MKPTLHFLLFIFLGMGQLNAQTEPRPIIVLSASGKVTYKPANGGKPIKVKAGSVLRDDGAIKLGANSSMLLMRDGKFAKFDQARPFQSYTDSINGQGLGFEYDFAKYVEASVSLAAFAASQDFAWVKPLTQKGGDGWAGVPGDIKSGSSGWGLGVSDPKDGSKGWGNAVSDPKDGSKGWGLGVSDPKDGSKGWGLGVSDPKDGSKGWGYKNNRRSSWGKADSRVTGILPFGFLLAEQTTFFWSNPGGAKSFLFSIKDENGNMIHKQEVRDTFCTVNLAGLNLAPVIRYQWSVSPEGKEAAASTPLEFQINSPNRRQTILNKVQSGNFFKKANDPALTRLAEAVILEKNKWYYDAWLAYRDLRRSRLSNLTKLLETAFWTRYELFPLAEKAAN